ncbi:MAG: ChbG/HpnK family deacetylase [Deltaproteobacteria bacterium]|nr:ChbG/HpnK family deacetylase [Deltaproteobacteria bacterium]
MHLRIHADDFGISPGVTRAITRCIDEGALNSVSVVANGAGFDDAIVALKARPHVAVSVHLNLVEQPPLSPRAEVSRLLDHRGDLSNSFASLTRAYGPRGVSADLRTQIRRELAAQVSRVRTALGPHVPLRLDSHGHLHHIPYVFAVTAEIARDLGANGVRLVHEPFFLGPRQTIPGIGRHFLLNALAAPHRRKLGRNDWFVGALLSGRMSVEALDMALARVHRRVGHSAEVEVLFHPGEADPSEKGIWPERPDLVTYYLSPWHRREAAVLCSEAMRASVSRWTMPSH